MSTMKWSGWGAEEVSFSADDKPALEVPDPAAGDELLEALRGAVGAEAVSLDALDRVRHARGKSPRDLVRHRAARQVLGQREAWCSRRPIQTQPVMSKPSGYASR